MAKDNDQWVEKPDGGRCGLRRWTGSVWAGSARGAMTRTARASKP